MLKKYESMIVIAGTLGEEDAKKENEKIISFIKKSDGEIIKTDEWGKRKLAYEIKKLKEGYYFINYFNYDTSKTYDLERYYRLNEKIIRYNILSGKLGRRNNA